MRKISLIFMLVFALVITGCGKEEKKEENKKEDIVIPDSPAASTEELKENLVVADVSKVTKDTIIFDETSKVEVGEKVAVWVYSEPKFLGYFEVKEVDGIKVIDGLEEKLKELNLEAGKHNIALTKESGESLGYVNIEIEETGSLQEGEVDTTTIKEITVKEEIAFKTETKYDSNKASGSKTVTQTGVKGEKEVTYSVVYDKEGNEISRTVVKENVLKEAVNQIEVIGKSDFNLNTTKARELPGAICALDKFVNGDCNDSEEQIASYVDALIINGVYYVKCNDFCNITGINSSIVKFTKSGNTYVGTINGKKYAYAARAGGATDEPLTEAYCNKYKLSCGRW